MFYPSFLILFYCTGTQCVTFHTSEEKSAPNTQGETLHSNLSSSYATVL